MTSVFMSCQLDSDFSEKIIEVFEAFETIKNRYNLSLSTLYSTDKNCLKYLEIIKNNDKNLIKSNSCSF